MRLMVRQEQSRRDRLGGAALRRALARGLGASAVVALLASACGTADSVVASRDEGGALELSPEDELGSTPVPRVVNQRTRTDDAASYALAMHGATLVTGHNARQRFAVELANGWAHLCLERPGTPPSQAGSSCAPQDRLSLGLAAWGREGCLGAPPVSAGPWLSGRQTGWQRGVGLEERFDNEPRGLDHSFVVQTPPLDAALPGEAPPLALDVVFDGAALAEPCERGARLHLRDGRVVYYSDLAAVDARGVRLPAWMEIDGLVVRLFVDDREARYPLRIDPLVWTEEQKLLPDTPAGGALFGEAVAMDGDRAIVGQPSNPFLQTQWGAAFLFERTAGVWEQVARIDGAGGGGTGGAPAVGDGFGWSVDIQGDTAVVGAMFDPDWIEFEGPWHVGRAWIFSRTDEGWVEQNDLVDPGNDPLNAFAISVALDGNWLAVGAPLDDEAAEDAGAAYLYERSGNNWSDPVKLLPPSPLGSEHFGYSVALDGSTLVVGAKLDSVHGGGAGAAHVFVTSTGAWELQDTLRPADGAVGDLFGVSVAVDGDTLLVGAVRGGNATSIPGKAYVFIRDAGSWIEQQVLQSSEAAPDDQFGESVQLDGDRAVVGGSQTPDPTAPGAGAVHVLERSGTTWTEIARLTAAPDPPAPEPENISLGRAVALEGTTLLAGAPAESIGINPASGAVYEFRFMRHTNGDPCSSGSDCMSELCVDEVCCNEECGQDDPNDCLACSVAAGASADGVCSSRPDDEGCDDGVFCNGADRCTEEGCTAHGGDPCPGAGQDNDDCHESCDEASASCSGYDGDDAPCEDGRCTAGICAREPGGPCETEEGCLDGWCVGGVCCNTADCGTFRCGPAGACLELCASSADCAPGLQCTSSGQCVEPGALVEEPSCDCASPGGRPASTGATFAASVLAGLTLALRRRRLRAPGAR